MTRPVLGVIPARIGSSRLPRKPLHPVLGRPLLEWVWRRVGEMELFDDLIVATDAPEVAELCREMGARVCLTDPDHPSGTHRVAEVSKRPEFEGFPVVVNVQGDEPLVREDHLARAVALVRDEGWDVGTCATPLGGVEDWRDPSVVKVVTTEGRGALYFSRAPIPHKREGEPRPDELARAPFLRHVGVYVYGREALLRWVSLPPSPLEELERLEQLRALEGGLRIGVAVVDGAGPGVDTEEDVTRMETILSKETPALAPENRP